MTEIDALKWELQQKENAFNRLHKDYINLLKKQGELEKENEQLKQRNKKLLEENHLLKRYIEDIEGDWND